MLERHGDVVKIATLADFMGNRWQNNAIMLPTPIWTNDVAYFLPVGTIMGLFSHHMGTQALAVNAPDGIDVAASRTEEKVFLHIVNLNRTQAKRLDFTIPGFNSTPSRILEINPNPEDEVSSMCAEIFAPHDVTPTDAYTLPAAAVAVMEFEKEAARR